MFRYIFPKSALNSLLNAMQYTIQWNSDYNRERERERSFSSSIVCQRVWLQFWIECDLKWLLFTFYSQKHDMNWEQKVLFKHFISNEWKSLSPFRRREAENSVQTLFWGENELYFKFWTLFRLKDFFCWTQTHLFLSYNWLKNV
jgi:hypothetical protein